MIISVGGLIGSGKTTLAKNICGRFNLGYISAGKIMRDMARDKNMSLLEFSDYAERHPEIDREIDEKQGESAEGDCVVDGRLSAYFTDPDFSIWLTAPLGVRAERVSDRDKIPVEDAKERIAGREKSEKKRYRMLYGIDLHDLSRYDLILNTENIDIKTLTEAVSQLIEKL